MERELATLKEEGGLDDTQQKALDGMRSAWSTMSTERPLYREALQTSIEQVRENLLKKKDDRLNALLGWTAESTEGFQKRDFPDDVAALEELVAALKSFDEASQPPRQEEKDSIDGEVGQLSSGQHSVMEQEAAQHDVERLSNAWQQMNKEKEEYRIELEKALRSAIEQAAQNEARQKRVDDLYAFIARKREDFSSRDFPDSLSELNALANDFDYAYLSSELPPKQDEKNELCFRSPDETETDSGKTELQDTWSKLEDEQIAYREALEDAIDRWRLDQLNAWISAKRSDFSNRDFPADISQLQQLADDFDGAYLTSELPPKQEEKEDLCDALEDEENQEPKDSLDQAWSDLQQEQADYREALEAAIKRCSGSGEQRQKLEELLAWMSSKRSGFSNRDFPTDGSELQQLADDYDNAYITAEAPPKQQEKESLTQALVGDEDTEASDSLQQAWDALQAEQVAYREALKAAMKRRAEKDQRQRQLDGLNAWIAEKRSDFSNRDFPTDAAQLQLLADNFDSAYLQSALPPKQQEKDTLSTTLAEETDQEPKDSLDQAWSDLQREQADYREALEAAIKRCSDRDERRQKLKALLAWMSSKRSGFSNRDFPTDGSELQQLADDYDNAYITAEAPPKQQEKESLTQALVGDEDTEASDSLQQTWDVLQAEQVAYRKALEAAMKRRAENDQRQQQLDDLNAWIAEKRSNFSKRDFPTDASQLQLLADNFDSAYLQSALPPKQQEKDTLSIAFAEEADQEPKTLLHQAWSDLQQEQADYREALEAAIKRCSDRNERRQKLEALLAWMSSKRSGFSNRDFPTDSSELQQLADDYDNAYITAEAPPKQQEKESLTQALVGDEDTEASDSLQQAWDALQAEQVAYREALEAAMKRRAENDQRQRQLDDLNAWIAEKRSDFSHRDFPTDLSQLQLLADNFDSAYLQSTLPPKQQEKDGLNTALVGEADQESKKSLDQAWSDLEQEQANYREALDGAIKRCSDRDERRQKLEALLTWMASKRSGFSNRDFPTDGSELQQLVDDYDNAYIIAEAPPKQQEKESLAQALVGDEDTEASDSLQQTWDALQAEHAAYREALDAAMKHHADKERRRQQLEGLNAWITGKRSAFSQRNFPSDVVALNQLAADYDSTYLTSELPPKRPEKELLVPALVENGDGSSSDSLQQSWAALENEQVAYREALEAAIKRCAEKGEHQRQFADFAAWVSAKRAAFSRRDFPSDKAELQALVTDYDNSYISAELPPKEREKNNVAKALAEDEDKEAHDSLQSSWAALQAEQEAYRQALEAAMKACADREEHQDQLDSLNAWISDKRSAFSTRSFPSKITELQELAANYDSAYLTSEHPPKQQEKDAVVQLLTSHEEKPDEESLQRSWNALQEEQVAYRQALDAALKDSKDREARQKELANLKAWISSKRAAFSSRQFPSAVAQLQKLATDYDDAYLKSELPPRSKQKKKLCQALASGGQSSQHKDLEETWAALEKEQGDYRAALEAALASHRKEAADADQREAELSKWISQKRVLFAQRNFPRDESTLRQLAADFDNEHMNVEVPPRQQAKNNITRSLAKQGKNAKGKELDQAWTGLQQEQADYRRALAAALQAAQQRKELEQRCNQLAQWVAAKKAIFSRRNFPDDISELQRLAVDYDNNYAAQEFPPKQDEKANLVQRLQGCGEGQKGEQLQAMWSDLEKEQHGYRQALQAAIEAAQRSQNQLGSLQQWVNGKRQQFSVRDFPDDEQRLEELRRNYDNDYTAQEYPPKRNEVTSFVNQNAPTSGGLQQSFQALQAEQADYRRALDAAIEKSKKSAQRDRLLRWVTDRTAGFEQRDFSGFGMDALDRANDNYSTYKDEELPSKSSEKAELLQMLSDGGASAGDSTIATAWGKLEREQVLYKEALDKARQEEEKRAAETDSGPAKAGKEITLHVCVQVYVYACNCACFLCVCVCVS